MAQHTTVFLRSTVYDGDYDIGAVRLPRMLRKIGFSAYILFRLFIPNREKDFLQVVDGIPFDARVHIPPGSDFGQTVDVIIGDIHSACISYFSVDNSNLPVVAVGGVVDVREGKWVELDNFDAPFTYFLEMFLFERLVVRPVAEGVEHSSHFNAFFYLFGQQVE